MILLEEAQWEREEHISFLISLLLFTQPQFLVWRQRVFERPLTKCKVILSLCALYLFLITVVHLVSTSVVSPTHTLHVLSTRDRHIRHHCHSRKNQKPAESEVEMCRASRRICWASDFFFPTNSKFVLFPTIWASLQPVGSDSPKEYGEGWWQGGDVALLWLSGFLQNKGTMGCHLLKVVALDTSGLLPASPVLWVGGMLGKMFL